MKNRTKAILIILAICLAVCFFPYAKSEYLTYKYGKEFVGLEETTHMLNASRYLKVIAYSNDSAKVFYVSDTRSLLTFSKSDTGEWILFEWKTINSDTGSADGFYWPYYF